MRCNVEAEYAVAVQVLSACVETISRDAAIAAKAGNEVQAVALAAAAASVDAARFALGSAVMLHRGLEHSDDPNHVTESAEYMQAFTNHAIRAMHEFAKENGPKQDDKDIDLPPAPPAPDGSPLN